MIKLGDKVKDKISGLEGIATEKTEYLNGCIQITIQAPYNKKTGEMPGWKIDIQQIEVVGRKKVVKKSVSGGQISRVR